MNLSDMADSAASHRIDKQSSILPLAEISKCRFNNTLKRRHKASGLLQLLFCLSLSITTPSFADLVSPVRLANKQGTSSPEPIAVLNAQDQTGNADDPSKYLEFIPATSGYKGIFKFTIPSNINQTLNSLTFHANFRGPQMSDKKWVFKLFDVQYGKWVTVADNSNAASWTWSAIDEAVTGDPNRFIDSNAQIRLKYSTGGNIDNSQLDFLALETTTVDPVTTPIDSPAPIPAPAPAQGNRWQPAIGTSWQIQYSGTINTALDVDAFNLDLFDTSAATIAALKAKGKYVICYFSAGSYENWRSDKVKFPASVLGQNLDGWAGERWLDVRQLTTLMPIMQARMQLAADKGCDAVDPDNVDGYSNSTGFSLGYNDQLAYNRALAQAAHNLGLAVSLKNDLDQIKDLVSYVDFAVNEECYQYNECGLLKPFIDAGKPVFGIEYNLSAASFCPQANASHFDFLKKNLSLDAARTACR